MKSEYTRRISSLAGVLSRDSGVRLETLQGVTCAKPTRSLQQLTGTARKRCEEALLRGYAGEVGEVLLKRLCG